MDSYLMIRLEGPLQAWGDVAVDGRRATRAFPSRSALAGLIASALGWTYRDGARTTALQDAMRFAVREDRRPTLMRDFQTAYLGRETQTWTWNGRANRGKGLAATDTTLMEKSYLADGSFLVALGLDASAPVSLEEVAAAIEKPARPLFLGRKSCPPAVRLFEGRIESESPYAALCAWPMPAPARLRCWYEPGDGPMQQTAQRVYDRRDFANNRFVGSRMLIEGLIASAEPEVLP